MFNERLVASTAGTLTSGCFRWTGVDICRVRVLQRRFEQAETDLLNLLGRVDECGFDRDRALIREVLVELYIEMDRHAEAGKYLGEELSIVEETLPEADMMTSALCRQAELNERCGRHDEARADALRCLRLCKKIGDRAELGAVLGILGQVHAAQGKRRRATSAFEASIRTLKNVHETYALMKASLAYGAFLVDQGSGDAETHLIEARQLSRKLEVPFFECQASTHLTRHATRLRLYEDARAHLDVAETLYEGLQPCDREQVKSLLEGASAELDQAILRTSVASAEELKTICRVYEGARFPMEEMRTEMAYQVAQSVGAEGLFLVRRRKSGHEIPLTYNLPKSEAKEIVRRLDRDRDAAFLGIDGEPKVLPAHTGQTMVVVPAPGERGYALCTLFESTRSMGPRQVEFLLAGAEALERVVLEEVGTRGAKAESEAFMSDEPEDARRIHPRGSFKEILTADPGMIRLIRLAERASASRAPIQLEGETGVGKELFARAIHGASPRREKPFVAVNAGGMPVNLLESQLFGHVRGAFTDAVADRVGLVEEAKGGTLFLDEVGEMGEELQVKLLRLLENGEYRRLGENTVHRADVRIISATNRDLAREVQRGRFRRDLFYRMGAVKLAIPPLRDRRRDIPLLIRHFLRECALYNGLVDRYFQIDMKAMEALELYEWPGNVRELYNEVLRIVSLIGNAETIRFGMLSDEIKGYLGRKQRADGILERTVEEFERRLILEALEKNDWNRMRTAEEIGVPRTTLLAKMKRLNIATRADVTARRTA
jgi:DNA-binding NtrC family response regulator/tetratricopeptide (TPR) repeat protein